MPSSANGDSLYIGRGKLYLDRFNPTTMLPTGILRFVGEADKADISITSTNKTWFTKTKATNNKIMDINIQQTHTITLDLMEYTKDNLALALLGTSAPVTQSGGVITGEAVAAGGSAGSIYQLKYLKTSAVTLTVGATPLASTDIEIEDPVLGLVRILPSATVGGGALTAAYTSSTVTFDRIASGQNVSIYARLIFVGDPTNGPQIDVEIWKVKINPAGVLSLLSDDFNKISFTGAVLDDSTNHPASPLYQVTYRDSAAGTGGGSITLADSSDGHTYLITMVDGNITVTRGGDGAPSTTLKLADTINGLYYSVTTAFGNLTIATASSTGAVSSITLADTIDGHAYSLTSVNGALTVTQIS